MHLCKADYYHNSFDGYRGECGGWERGIQIPVGGSIKVLIRTQGERFKVLQDDEGHSNGKPELIAFPSSRLIAEKGYDMDVWGNTDGM